MKSIKDKKIGLALSGGGVRASAFHAGVLRYLAQRNLFEQITHVSTVSGGSLLAGLVFSNAGNRWPTSTQYIANVFPSLRSTLTEKSLQRSAIVRLLLNPLNWQFVLARAHVVAEAIQSVWKVYGVLGDIPASPAWSINATTAETGVRFRFKVGTKAGRKSVDMGDYETGYAETGNFSIARAMAISAAFPGGIGPLRIDPSASKWLKSPYGSNSPPTEIILGFDTLHLYDGGVYDNLGMESLFNVGTQQIKHDKDNPVDFVIASDAGAPLTAVKIPSPLNPVRFKRLADIASSQTRKLRVRAFVNALTTEAIAGAYVQMGADARKSINELRDINRARAKELLACDWLDCKACSLASGLETTLRRLSTSEFDLLEKHGFETAKWNMELYGY